MFQKILYNFAIRCYVAGINIKSLTDQKAAKWVKGRKDQKGSSRPAFPNQKYVWVHCASLGEYEQGRPIIDAIKEQYPDIKVLLTFFSPSGYEVVKGNQQLDEIKYLPADLPGNAHGFLRDYQLIAAIFIKYDLWYNFIKYLKAREVPTYLISAIFRQQQIYFKSYGGLFRKILSGLNHIFVQDQQSIDLLKGIGINQTTVIHDTRFDRVLQIAGVNSPVVGIEDFKGNSPLMVIGSSWPGDEELLIRFINGYEGNWKFIIAPHEVNEEHINKIEKGLKITNCRYSQGIRNESKVLIIDIIGLLSKIYRYGEIAYIGGGFSSGIHNCLEAAVFGNAILFGPNYSKFKEARDLLEFEGALSVNNYNALETQLSIWMENDNALKNYGNNAFRYVKENSGGTEKVMELMKPILSGGKTA